MLILRSNQTVHQQLVAAAEHEFDLGQKRYHAEQGFLLTHFPSWLNLSRGYNLPHYTLGKLRRDVYEGNASLAVAHLLRDEENFYLHLRLRDMPEELSTALGFYDAWAALQNQTVVCHRPDGNVTRRLAHLAHNLSYTAEGLLVC